MSKLAKREYNNSRFPRPLPIQIPLLHISNNYFTPYEVFESVQRTISHIIQLGFTIESPVDVVFDVYTDMSFKIMQQNDMLKIWDNGFYGKGILSRSEPTWLNRTEKKVKKLLKSKLKSIEPSELKFDEELYSEEVTKNRRLFRNMWKKERERFLLLEKDIKLNSVNGVISDEDRIMLDIEREKLAQLKDDLTKGPKGVNPDILQSQSNSPLSTPINSSDEKKDTLRMEDYDIIIDSNNVRNLEYLELDPCETLFLLQYNIINVKINNELIHFNKLVQILVETFGPIIINEYVVYYHYKTLGWCIRNGLKFSCDWVLYSRGPPFSHAEFSIKVVNENDNNYQQTESLTDFSAISRVVTGVKKSLIICFVDGPELDSDDWWNLWNEYLIDNDFINFINNFSINEVTWNRWTPSRTRM